MHFGDDDVHLPLTFPTVSISNPTPGTTYLNEPPDGEMPPPRPTVAPVREDSPLVEIPIYTQWHPLSLMRNVCEHLGSVQDKANALEAILFDKAKADEEKAPIQVQVVQ